MWFCRPLPRTGLRVDVQGWRGAGMRIRLLEYLSYRAQVLQAVVTADHVHCGTEHSRRLHKGTVMTADRHRPKCHDVDGLV